MSDNVLPAISAGDFQLASSTRGWEWFVRLCNSLVWVASSAFPGLPLPQVTEVSGADGGVDACYEVTDLQVERPAPWVRRGRNVFQYKWRDPGAYSRRERIGKLNLRRALQKLGTRPPDHYVLFTNLQLNRADVKRLEEAIRQDAPGGDGTSVEIVGADKLAAALAEHPQLRAAFLAPRKFESLADALRRHEGENEGVPPFVGRDEERAQVRQCLSDATCRVIQVTGLAGVGKTRLVLEGLKEFEAHVVVALDSAGLSADVFEHLRHSRSRSILLAENVSPERAEALIDEALTHQSMTLVVTRRLPAVDSPRLWDDHRLRRIDLGPLFGPSAFELLQSVAGPADWSFLEWVTNQVGCTPQLLLLAARHHEALRARGTRLIQDLGQALADDVRRRVGEDGLTALEPFSLLSRTGFEGAAAGELEAVCAALVRTPPSERHRHDLEAAGFLVLKPGFASVYPPGLATWLAGALIREHAQIVPALLASLDEGAVLRLLDRLVEIPSTDSFWPALLGPSGAFPTEEDVVRGLEWLSRLAVAAPASVVDLVERHFNDLHRRCTTPDKPPPGSWDEVADMMVHDQKHPEERKRYDPSLEPRHARRGLVMLLQVLLEFPDSAEKALDFLYVLAAQETEIYANNAANMFKAAFWPYNHTIGLPLFRRLQKLRRIANKPAEERPILLDACEGALQFDAVIIPSQRTHRPDELRDRPTGEEIRDYLLAVADLAMGELDGPLEAEAWKRLPRMLVELGARVGAPSALDRLNRLVERTIEHPVRAPVTEIRDALADIKMRLQRGLENPDLDAARRQAVVECISRVEAMQTALSNSSFAARARTLIGHGSWTDLPDHGEIGAEEQFRRFLQQVEQLAEQAANQPAFVDDALWTWLLSYEASRSGFLFEYLGEKACDDFWLRRLVGSQIEPGARAAFTGYCRGWERKDPDKAASFLADTVDLTPRLVAVACVSVRPTPLLARRASSLLQARGIYPAELASALTPEWILGLAPADSADFLEHLRMSGPLGPALVLSALCDIPDFSATASDTPPARSRELIEIAWRSLETPPKLVDESAADPLAYLQTQSHLAWACETVAARLAVTDPERAARLLATLIQHPGDRKTWNPIDATSQHPFWAALLRIRPKRAIETVLDAQPQEETAWLIPWHLRGILDLPTALEAMYDYAEKGEEQAIRVAACLHRHQKGFWELADRLLSRYPDSEPLRSTLAAGMNRTQMAWAGSEDDLRKAIQADIEAQLRNQWPAPMREWLRRLLRQVPASRAFWDYEITETEVDDLLQGPDSKDRRLAVIRLLTSEPWSVIRKKLSVADIRNVLPDLPEKRRLVLETAVREWSGGGR